MDYGIRGKRAFISGSTAGIGLATARALAAEGAHVTVNGRTAERVDRAVEQIRGALPDASVQGIAANLATADGCAAVTEVLPEIDILVNSLGIFEPKPFEEISDADWMRFFETNVVSGIRLTRHYLPGMRSRDWGRVVFVSSESALQVPIEMMHYGMTKTAQLSLARGLAETLAGTGVTVNSVLPGPTDSEGVGGFFAKVAAQMGVDREVVVSDFFKNARPSSILKRFASPDEVAAMIAYVCSAQASATTGAALRVDGGVLRSVV